MKSIILGTLLNFVLTVALFAQDSIVGIGVSLGTERETGALKVMKVIPGGPAEKAGLPAGVILRKVNDIDVVGKRLTECIALIRGPIGSTVNLEVVDPAAHATNHFEIARDKIILAQPKRSHRGDPAAPLKLKEWVRGAPVDVKDGKAVYVVEFWATWCPPCRMSIPHLTELQKQFKDKGVVIVGISDEDPGTVKPFVTKMAAQMDYTVACDSDQQTYAAYMEAFGHNGIPTAFVVGKDGRVLWDGHPMAGLDKAIEAVLAGNTPE